LAAPPIRKRQEGGVRFKIQLLTFFLHSSLFTLHSSLSSSFFLTFVQIARMTFRKFQADQLFTGTELLDGSNILVTDEAGLVIDIVPIADAGDGIQKMNGWLSPGFVNSHCHLELSHMKGLIPEHTGLVDFVISIITQRHIPEDEILQAMVDAEAAMLENGIVAVGDISNNAISFAQKAKQRLAYYTFLEISGFTPQVTQLRFDKGLEYYQQFEQINSKNHFLSMAAHAPYSVSKELWQLMQPYFKNKTTTLHNQETEFEDAFFLNKSGDFIRLYDFLHVNLDFFSATGKSSLRSVAHNFNGAAKTLLVHDVFTKQEDIQFIKELSLEQQNQFYYCLCINANQYISKAIPPIDLLRKNSCKVVVGTDSLASNHQLNILEELKTISQNFKNIPLQEQLQWATINGAQALGFEHLGSFEKGKKPGVVLIDEIENNALTNSSKAKRLL
jgi:cytosine/adenosine deaminase-related metal-dependent hydrolase